ncbi:hypothetical protein A8139_16960 [Marinomonas primoryensis]|uniref:Uncharacterized protein n=2 Tax=Marinomonas primoryensis TaxID=178399 RepID=A0A2Z4PV10_9GAMM|nr:hypothetical protein A8139_16960 [Marinomonas primoryensis]
MPVYADINWMSATLDNDFFVNEDNGYTNGVYVSFYDIHENVTAVKQPDFWVAPLMWSMTKQGIDNVVNVYSAGQALTTSRSRCFSRQLSPKLLSSFFVLLWI